MNVRGMMTGGSAYWFFCVLCFACFTHGLASEQDRLKTMPGYERYQFMRQTTTNAVKLGTVRVDWKDGGNALEYNWDGRRFRYDIATGAKTMVGTATNRDENRRTGRRRRVEGDESVARGRQSTRVKSPDGQWEAAYRDCNLWLSATNSTNALAVTTEGSTAARLKFGTASWVYGEDRKSVV